MGGGWCRFLHAQMVGLSCFHFSDFVLYFPLEKGGNDDDGHDVNDQNRPIPRIPCFEHRTTSNRWTDVDVHVAPRTTDASQTGPFFDQKIVKAGRQFFRQRDLAEDETDHAGAAGA